MSDYRLKIGITQGDTNGIGWEVILRTFADARIAELFTPVIYGSPKAAAYYAATLEEEDRAQLTPVASAAEARRGKVNMVECGDERQAYPRPKRARPPSTPSRLPWLTSRPEISTPW